MRIQLKPISEQVMVITGASSGIGLTTARLAAREGAAVALAARNAADLAAAVETIRAAGGRAVHEAADVSDPAQVSRIAEAALRAFGRIDTWVNNAGVAIYGRLVDVPLEDMRRQFDINYWGQVYGSLTAIRHLASAGGVLINVASAVADRAIPLQGNYCASKQALKGFTDALRMELEEAGVPMVVTLIKPSSIDTPLFEKAKTFLGREPQPVPPVYAPELVARVIVAAAQRPLRDVIVGGMGKVLSLATHFPRITDRYMERSTFRAQVTSEPAKNRPSNLYEPVAHDGGERGRNWKGRTMQRSAYTGAKLHPRRAAALAAAAVAGLARVARRWRGRDSGD